MIFQSSVRSGAAATQAGKRSDEHQVIKTVGRLVLLCAGVLVISATLLVATALQVMRGIDEADLNAERQRAANAVDAMVGATGPLNVDNVAYLGRIAGLRNAHLEMTLSTSPAAQQMPLVGGQGPSGSYLTWTRSPTADALFRQFAPIRLPIIGGMMLVVLGLLLRMRGLVVDLERQRSLAVRQSHSDVVTGLANRLAFETALADLTRGTAPFALVIFDLDRFKSVNDAYGHAAGDEVLRAVAARLTRLQNSGDMLARLGGDEFVMLCTSRTGAIALSTLAQHCIAAIEQPIRLGGDSVRVGVSLGIVPADAPHLPPATLIGAADAALYRAKSTPGSGFRFAGDEPAMVFTPTPLRATA